MYIVYVLFLFLIGLLLIIKGGDFFVDAASWIAEISGIPSFIIGATIVSLATTLPELLVSVIAASQGKVDMAIGNGVGSVTANLGLIMGISLLFAPSAVKRKDFIGKALIMIAAAIVITVFSFTGTLILPGTILLVLLFISFLIENIHQAKSSNAAGLTKTNEIKKDKQTIIKNLLKFVGGAAAIVVGADLLVDNGSILAEIIGIPESVVAVTLVAIGTSLPELVTTITAIVKKQSSLSLGNILGANIIDLTLILPASSIAAGKSLTVSKQSLMLDFPFCLILCLVSCLPLIFLQKGSKLQGSAHLILYLVYLVLICVITI